MSVRMGRISDLKHSSPHPDLVSFVQHSLAEVVNIEEYQLIVLVLYAVMIIF